ncbi:MAG: DUF1501 domain-containing protein [Chloroflexota bacterium]
MEDSDMTNLDRTVTRCCDEYDTYQRRQSALRHSRRTFLKTTVGAVAATTIAPHILLDSAMAAQVNASAGGPILVVIQLAGGNDGLNTIVPYGSDLYYQDRPTIGVPAKSVIPIDHMVGFNPNLQPLKNLYDKGKVAIVQGVGYPNPDRSHFRGTQIWESADPVGDTTTGWLGRYLDTALADVVNPLKAVALGSIVPITLQSERSPVPAIESVQTFRFALGKESQSPIMNAFREMYAPAGKDVTPYMGLVRTAGSSADKSVADLQSVTSNYTPSVKYPLNPLGRELQLVAQIIASGLGTRIFHVTLGGFDDHVAEVYTHANLLKYLGESLAAFYQDLETHGKADDVVTMTFSEFGRRIKENAGRGTDHGTAAPVMVVGGKVKGGLYGDDPIMSKTDNNGDLVYGVDFRSVYSTILENWLGTDPRSILNGSFERLPFL